MLRPPHFRRNTSKTRLLHVRSPDGHTGAVLFHHHGHRSDNGVRMAKHRTELLQDPWPTVQAAIRNLLRGPPSRPPSPERSWPTRGAWGKHGSGKSPRSTTLAKKPDEICGDSRTYLRGMTSMSGRTRNGGQRVGRSGRREPAASSSEQGLKTGVGRRGTVKIPREVMETWMQVMGLLAIAAET